MTPQTPTREQPAKPKIGYLGRTSYSVASRTRAGHMHYVDTYRLTCTCEAGRSGKRCWALVAALGYEDWCRRQQAQAAASTARLLAPAQPGQPKAGMVALQEAF